MFRIFLAQQRSGADVAAGDRACCSAGSPSRRRPTSWPGRCATSSSGWSGPPSSGSRSSATWRAASGSAGSTSRWSTPSAPACWPGSATRSPRSPPIPTPRTGPRGWTRWPRSRSRSSASSPSGWRAACREREPMLEVLVRRHYREHDLHDLRRPSRDGPPVRGGRLRRSTTARPGWSPPSARSPSSADPAAPLVTAVAERSSARRPGTRRCVDLYVSLARRARRHRRRPARSSPQLVGALPFARDVRRIAVAVCPGGDRPVNYFTYRPRRRRRDRRGRPGPRRAPDGRPPARTCGGCATSTSPASRRPRTCCSTSAWRGRTRPTGGSSRWRRSVSSPSSATRTAGSPPCRTRSGRWRTAWRRSAGPAPRAARPGASSTSTTCGCRSGRWSTRTSSS